MNPEQKFNFAQKVITWCISVIASIVNLFRKKRN